MKISVVYATAARQAWLNLEVDAGTTIAQAIDKSGIKRQFPEIDLAVNKVGIYGKVATPETVLEEGARVEIYRPIIVDPKTVKRRPKAEVG